MRIDLKRTHAGRRGSVLVLSLVAVTTVVVLAASFSRFASTVANRQAQAVNRKRAFYLAEAGLSESFAGLSCGKTGAVGSSEAPALLGDGVFWVEATELEPGFVRLESTGMIGTGRATLALVAARGEKSVAALGVFSAGNIALGSGSLVDAYDSSKGSYASQADKSGAALGSNAGIQITGSLLQPTTIKGDVTPGPEQTLATTGSVTITGSTSPSLAAIQLPPVTVPEISLAPAQVHSSPYPLVIPAGSSGYESLSVQAGAQVIIQGPAQIVLGSLSVAASAELAFDTTQGKVELYVTDALDLAAQSLLTTSSTRPQDVLIQVPGQTAAPLSFQATGQFHGVIYAPEAPLVLGSAFEVFGALVADALTFQGAARLHFDRYLAALAAEEALPTLASWRIVELGNSSSDLAQDPFDLLGLDRSLLPTPSGAHADQLLAIDYYDAGNVYHRYNGPESSFDWNVVKTVISATRDGAEVLFPRESLLEVGLKKSPGVLPVVDGPMI